MLEIKFKKLQDNAVTPIKKYNVDAGFDMTVIWKNYTDQYVEYGTGITFEIPNGYVGLLFPRSSIRNRDLMLKNSVGVVDASYRGEIKFSFHDLNNDDVLDYDIGERCGQIVFIKIPDVNLIESQELNETKRGTAGYGSSGK